MALVLHPKADATAVIGGAAVNTPSGLKLENLLRRRIARSCEGDRLSQSMYRWVDCTASRSTSCAPSPCTTRFSLEEDLHWFKLLFALSGNQDHNACGSGHYAAAQDRGIDCFISQSGCSPRCSAYEPTLVTTTAAVLGFTAMPGGAQPVSIETRPMVCAGWRFCTGAGGQNCSQHSSHQLCGVSLHCLQGLHISSSIRERRCRRLTRSWSAGMLCQPRC